MKLLVKTLLFIKEMSDYLKFVGALIKSMFRTIIAVCVLYIMYQIGYEPNILSGILCFIYIMLPFLEIVYNNIMEVK